MKNKLTEKDFLKMIEIINGDKLDDFKFSLSWNSLNPYKDNNYFVNKLKEIVDNSINEFNQIVFERENTNEKLSSLDYFKNCEKMFTKIVFENIMINLDKDIDSIEIELNGYAIKDTPIRISQIIESYYSENNKVEIYNDWINKKIKHIEHKVLSYISTEIAKKTLHHKKDRIIENKVFGSKVPNLIKFFNLLIYDFPEERIKEYNKFEHYLDKINTFFKYLDSDFFKLDLLYLRKLGKENYEKDIPHKNIDLDNFNSKVLTLMYKEFTWKNRFYTGYFNEKNKEDLYKIFKDVFFINLGFQFRNEKDNYKKICKYILEKYSIINSENEYNKAIAGPRSTIISQEYFNNLIDDYDVWQEEYFTNKFDQQRYKEIITEIIDKKIKPEIKAIFERRGILFNLENVNYDFIYRINRASIWEPILLTFDKKFDELKKHTEWFENFIYRFVYENEMSNIWNGKTVDKPIILDSYNADEILKSAANTFKNLLDDDTINKIEPFIFVDNNLLSAQTRISFARYEYYGDILYKLIIESLKLKCIIRVNNGVDYLSSSFQNLICKNIGLDKVVKTNNLFFGEKKNNFELADYLESFLWNLYLIKGFVFTCDFIEDILKKYFSECIIDESIINDFDKRCQNIIKIRNINITYSENKLDYFFENQGYYNVNQCKKEIDKLTKNIIIGFAKINSYENKEEFKKNIDNYYTFKKSDFDWSLIESKLSLKLSYFWFSEESQKNLYKELRILLLNDFEKFKESINDILEKLN